MENVWLILAVCVLSAGYIVFELQALGNKLKLYEHNLSELKNQQSAERHMEHYFQVGKANRRFKNGIQNSKRSRKNQK